MPTSKAELERLVEELQQKLEKAQQSKESIEAAVQAAMTFQFEEELARAVAAERKRTKVVQQHLEAMQKTMMGSKVRWSWLLSKPRMYCERILHASIVKT